MLDVFAPRNAAEFARVIRPGGMLIVVVPAENHLHELSALELELLHIEPDKVERVVDNFRDEFRLASSQVLEYVIELDAHEVQDLLRMTPNAWHLDDAAWARVAELEPMRVTVGFHTLQFRRHDGQKLA
jgi:23S rRNA (guanine745-N1)-methyltransferase